AFEGAAIRCGMRAAEGAIEVVRVTDGALELGVIGDVAPRGLCGSGLVDAVATLVDAGLIDASGRFVPDERAAAIAPTLAERLTRIDGERAFVLDGHIALYQRDVRSLQFAKAAIATGWTLLLETLDIDVADVQQVLLAGSFGSYLSPASAIRIGLVPRL